MKIVNEEFRETKKVKRTGDGNSKDPFEAIATAFGSSPMRIKKMILRMQESGTWNEVNTAKNIGPLLGLVYKDLVAEELEHMQHEVWKKFVNTYLNKAVAEAVRKEILG
jgi:hypothetical protein